MTRTSLSYRPFLGLENQAALVFVLLLPIAAILFVRSRPRPLPAPEGLLVGAYVLVVVELVEARCTRFALPAFP